MKYLRLIMLLGLVFSCSDIIEVVNISDDTVRVLAPTNGVLLDEGNMTFTWKLVEDADTYHLQIATPDFETAQQIITDTMVSNTYFNKTLDAGTYQWQVRAENSGYQTGYTSQKFTLLPLEPIDISNETVSLIAPIDNATFSTSDSITFTWEAVDYTSEYVLQIVTPNFENPIEVIESKTTISTHFSVSNLSKKTYEFRVKAKNTGFETDYTTIGFTVNE
ncbi:hypothetical protein [Thalassobellus citreus]|uniref:fibronectin type III domain-containing protein n=1 Tax=Thalassobellus citreus TaxID=3367752 RepID=UPI0037881451